MTPWVPVLLAAAAAFTVTAPLPVGGARLRAAVAAPPPALPSPRAVVAGAVVVGAVVLGPVVSGLAVLGVLLLRQADRRRRAARRAATERGRALDALAMLAAELRIGRVPADAFASAAEVAAGPSAAAFAAASAAARLGGDVSRALHAPESEVAAVLCALTACWRVCSEAGHGLAAAVARLEDGLRAAETQRLLLAAELAGPRATAQLLAGLPVVGLGLAAALGAQPLRVLLHTPVGLACLSVGLALDVAGVVWTHHLTERAMS